MYSAGSRANDLFNHAVALQRTHFAQRDALCVQMVAQADTLAHWSLVCSKFSPSLPCVVKGFSTRTHVTSAVRQLCLTTFVRMEQRFTGNRKVRRRLRVTKHNKLLNCCSFDFWLNKMTQNDPWCGQLQYISYWNSISNHQCKESFE